MHFETRDKCLHVKYCVARNRHSAWVENGFNSRQIRQNILLFYCQ